MTNQLMSGHLPTAAALPDGLTTRDQWVCWRTQKRNGKQTKVPINPAKGSFASATNPETWDTFAVARERAVDNDSLGLGFVFTAEDQLVGVDLDDCRDPETGESDPWAKSIIDQLDSYTEISPSGTGYHVLTLGSLLDGRNRNGDLEVYDDARFFTVSGDHVSETPETLSAAPDALTAIYDEYLAPDDETSSDEPTPSESGSTEPSECGSSPAPASSALSDDELLEKAQSADNGEKFSRLWAGQTGGYESHSEADMALCSLLAFWTGGDATQADRLFRQSGLMREKWDERHFADGSTYGETTIKRAIDGCSAFYSQTSEPRTHTQEPKSAPSAEPATSMQAAVTQGNAGGTNAQSTESPAGTDSSRDQLDRIERLISELDAAVDQIEELEEDLAAERTRRRELEAELAEVRNEGRWWWPFD